MDNNIDKLCQSCKNKCKQWHTVYACKKYKQIIPLEKDKGGKGNGNRVLSNK